MKKEMLYDKQRLNRGSAVLEMTLLMPVLIGIIMLVVFLLLDTIYDATVQGDGYTSLYTFSDGEVLQENTALLQDALNQKIAFGEIAVLGFEKMLTVQLDIASRQKNKGVYGYEQSERKVIREKNICADRLRRWQVYGDVIWE